MITLVHANGCLTTIDNSRRARYGYDQRVEVFGSDGMAASGNPLGHTATVSTAGGTSSATLPYFFLERYIPSYLREWEAFVAPSAPACRPPVGPRDARAPLVTGLAAWMSAPRRPRRQDRGGERMTAMDLITMGRIGVDLYPEQIGVRLADVRRSPSRSAAAPTNVAVAAARLGAAPR